jgi:hypothetical protein
VWDGKGSMLFLVQDLRIDQCMSSSNTNGVSRWILLDDQFRIQRTSHPFFFLHRGQESPAGLCWKSKKQKTSVVVTVGWMDKELWAIVIPVSFIRKSLHSIDALRCPIDSMIYDT